MSKRRIIIAIVVLVFACVACVYQFLYAGYYRYIAAYGLGNGYSLEIWGEQPGLADPGWDPDDAPGLYYQIKQFGAVVVPQTFLTIDFRYIPDVKIAFAEQGFLVCVYDIKPEGDGFFIMWDATSGESWPRLRDDEASSNPVVLKKWTDRYKRLKAVNPDLPPF